MKKPQLSISYSVRPIFECTEDGSLEFLLINTIPSINDPVRKILPSRRECISLFKFLQSMLPSTHLINYPGTFCSVIITSLSVSSQQLHDIGNHLALVEGVILKDAGTTGRRDRRRDSFGQKWAVVQRLCVPSSY